MSPIFPHFAPSTQPHPTGLHQVLTVFIAVDLEAVVPLKSPSASFERAHALLENTIFHL